VNYRLAYRVGFHPWEDAERQSGFVGTFEALLATQESGREPPYGKALDVGTGSGIWGIKLAERGWQVTGIDVVEVALRRAAARVRDAGIEMRLVHADVAALRGADVGSDFELVLDTGTFHGLSDVQRQAMGRGVSEIASADATLLMLSWAPRRRGPLPQGAGRSEIEAAFPGWSASDAGATGFEAPAPIELLLKPDERWFRLRRN
jgi:SAM-dependent methyltransferase